MHRAVETQCAGPVECNSHDFLLITNAGMNAAMQKYAMISRIALLVMLCAQAGITSAAGRFFIKFELMQDAVVINRGNDYVTEKSHSWSKGLKSSYLKLRCDRTEPNKLKKCSRRLIILPVCV